MAPRSEIAPGVVATHSKTPSHGGRIAVIGGTPRAGRLVAKYLAAAMDRDRRDGTTVSDAGSIVGTPAWTSAIGSADRLILAVDAVGTGPAEAASLLDQVARGGEGQSKQILTIVLLPPPRRGLGRGHEDIGAIRAHFSGRTRAVLFVPNDPNPTPAATAAWARITATL